MREILLWLVAIIMVGFFISPFFIFWNLKNKNIKKYLVVSTVASLLIYVWVWIWGYDLIGDISAKIDADLYYFYYDASDYAMFYIYDALMVISPFIYTKIIYGKISVFGFLGSLAVSVLIFIAMFLFFAYVLFPMAGSVLLNNI